MNIKELAEQAGMHSPDGFKLTVGHMAMFQLEKFAELVAAQTRARCIELVLAGTGMPVQTRTLEALQRDRKRIAALIEEDGK
jgi:hypothetical protein